VQVALLLAADCLQAKLLGANLPDDDHPFEVIGNPRLQRTFTLIGSTCENVESKVRVA
jgi:hypothetical protein